MKGDKSSPGIIRLGIQDIFKYIDKTPEREYLLRVSYIEIYNEILRDLLSADDKKLKIHEDLEVFLGIC